MDGEAITQEDVGGEDAVIMPLPSEDEADTTGDALPPMVVAADGADAAAAGDTLPPLVATNETAGSPAGTSPFRLQTAHDRQEQEQIQAAGLDRLSHGADSQQQPSFGVRRQQAELGSAEPKGRPCDHE